MCCCSFWLIPEPAAHLLSKWKEAIKQVAVTEDLHEQFTKSLNKDLVNEWTRMILEHNADSSKPNPFEGTIQSESLLRSVFQNK
jgi:hypothetical protein